MIRITQLQPAQAIEAVKDLDSADDSSQIRSLAHEMNIASSPEVGTKALKKKIIEVFEYHEAKLKRKQMIADNEKDVPDLPVKPNLRVTVKGNKVPNKLESEVDFVVAEESEKPKEKKETKKKDS